MLRALTAVLIMAAAVEAVAFPEGADPGHTGLDEQPDCGTCHYLGPPADPHSGLEFVSLPQSIEAGQMVEFVLRVRDPEARKGGFQLTSMAVNQVAGRFLVGTGQRLDTRKGHEYLGHSQPRNSQPDTGESGQIIEWRIQWQAPSRPGPVRLAAAAVAADGDASALGDNSYQREQIITVTRPAESPASPPAGVREADYQWSHQ